MRPRPLPGGRDKPVKALIVGLGSIGRRHLRNLRHIRPDVRVAACRLSARNDGYEQDLEPDSVVYSLDDALSEGADCGLVTCPASVHVAVSLALARRDIHLFVEKPLSNTLEGVDELIEECRRRGLVLAVGYNLRFLKPLRIVWKTLHEGRIGRPTAIRAEVGQYLPDWRPGRDYRRSVSSQQALGGGAVLELSHELDYVRWLLGEVDCVTAQVGKLSDLDIDVEDTAEILLRFRSGAFGSVHLDMVQRPPRRVCHILGTEGTLCWDGWSDQVKLYDAASKTWSDLYSGPGSDLDNSYVEELRDFLDSIENNTPAKVNGYDGRRALEIALAVKQSAEQQRAVAV